MRKWLLTVIGLVALAGAAAPQEVLHLGPAPAATLVVPYFAVDRTLDAVTLLSVTNVGETTRVAHVVLWTQGWQPTLAFDLVLGPNDIQSLDVTSLLNGRIPITDPAGLAGCGEYARPAFGAAEKQRLWDDHMGTTCLGDWTAPLAVGFITIDVVETCTPLATRSYDDSGAWTPITTGYFEEGGTGLARNANVLVGDFQLVRRDQDLGRGENAWHLRADEEFYPRGSETFYEALGTRGTDHRAPLPGAFFSRSLNGGLFRDGSTLVIFRTPPRYVPAAAMRCGQSPWSDRSNAAELLTFDEGAKTLVASRPMPWATQEVALSDWPEIARFGGLRYQFVQPVQTSGLISQNAGGKFSTGSAAVPVARLDLSDAFRVDFTAEVDGLAARFSATCLEEGRNADCGSTDWYFGDGTETKSRNPRHTYLRGGSFDVTVIAENVDGQRASSTRTIAIVGGPGGGDDGGGDDGGGDDGGGDDGGGDGGGGDDGGGDGGGGDDGGGDDGGGDGGGGDDGGGDGGGGDGGGGDDGGENQAPAIALFECDPNTLSAGLAAVCRLRWEDADGGEIRWQVEVVQGEGMCLELGLTCSQRIEGSEEGPLGILLEDEIVLTLRTTPLVETSVLLRAVVVDADGASAEATEPLEVELGL